MLFLRACEGTGTISPTTIRDALGPARSFKRKNGANLSASPQEELREMPSSAAWRNKTDKLGRLPISYLLGTLLGKVGRRRRIASLAPIRSTFDSFSRRFQVKGSKRRGVAERRFSRSPDGSALHGHPGRPESHLDLRGGEHRPPVSACYRNSRTTSSAQRAIISCICARLWQMNFSSKWVTPTAMYSAIRTRTVAGLPTSILAVP